MEMSNSIKDALNCSNRCLVNRFPNSPYVGILEPRMLRSALEEFTKCAYPNLTLSKKSSALARLIQRLAIYIADISAPAIQDDPQQSLQNLQDIVQDLFGEELYFNAQGHANLNLHYFLHNSLEFYLKPLPSHPKEISQEDDQPAIFAPSIRKLAKNNYHASLSKDASNKMETLMLGIMNTIVEDMKQHLEPNTDETCTISIADVYNTIRRSLSINLFKGASSHAQCTVIGYRLGILKYEPKEKAIRKGTETEVSLDEFIKPDFKNGIKRIHDEYSTQRGKGFLAHMDSILNNVCVALAEKCAESAHNNGRKILQENDVFNSLNAMLPQNMKQRAFARIQNIKNSFNLPTSQLHEIARQQAAETRSALSSDSIPKMNTEKQAIPQFSSTETRSALSSDSVPKRDNENQAMPQFSSAENTISRVTEESGKNYNSENNGMTRPSQPGDEHSLSKPYDEQLGIPKSEEEHPVRQRNGLHEIEFNSKKEHETSVEQSQELEPEMNRNMNGQ